LIRANQRQARDLFSSKIKIAKLLAEPYSKGIRKHHKGENITGIEYVNRYFLFIFMR
jgi:hypothetical protein